MRITDAGGGRRMLRMSREEWAAVGAKAGWTGTGDYGLDSAAEPAIEITPRGRVWAVTVNGELLCLTVYLKGATAVKGLVEGLWRRMREGGGKGGISSSQGSLTEGK